MCIRDRGYATKPTSVFVPTTVRVKQYRGTAYLHVPEPSGDLLTQGFGTGASTDQSDETEPDTGPEDEVSDVIREPRPTVRDVRNSISGQVHGTAIQAGYIDSYTHHRGGDQNVTGNDNIVVGRDLRGGVNRIPKKKRGDR